MAHKPSPLVPRLRFPEFRDAPDWKIGRCRDIARVLSGYGFPNRFQGNKEGTFPFYKVSDISYAIEQGSKYISEARNYIEPDVLLEIRGKTVPTGTIIFAKIGEAIRSNRRVVTTEPAVIDNNTAGVKAIETKSSDEFLFYIWSNVSLIEHAGGVVPAVSKSALENVPLCYPSDPEEQQHIADCLGSLDDLIAAGDRKLKALRQHKQGLMQQLFPRPGETVPRLRFAEFVDEPPWECLPLKKLAKRITQRNIHGSFLRTLTNSAENGVVDQREYFDRDIATNTDHYYIMEMGDYVYNPRISSSAPVGPISKNKIGMGVTSPLYTVFRFQNDTNDFFAHYFMSSHWHGYLRRISNRGARHDRMAVKNDDVMQMPIPTPSSHEQQKIADCLGSLDDLIAAEDRKLEALRQHKQGLMQQLFPSLDGSGS